MGAQPWLICWPYQVAHHIRQQLPSILEKYYLPSLAPRAAEEKIDSSR